MTPTDTLDANRSWNLKSFMDSLILELDRGVDVLAVRGLNRPVTYTVKDVDVDLRCFPVYDGRQVRFLTAKPGEDGSSSLRFSLGSISAGTIRDSAPRPPEADDVAIDEIEEIDPETRDALAGVGVRTGRDLERIAGRGVDLRTVTDRKTPDFSDLAALITKAQRRRIPPRVDAAQLSVDERRLVLHVDGDHLSVSERVGFPYALLDGVPREVRSAGPHRVSLDAAGFRPRSGPSRLTMALDPLTVVTLELTP